MIEKDAGFLGDYWWSKEKIKTPKVIKSPLEEYREKLIKQGLNEEQIKQELEAFILCNMD